MLKVPESFHRKMKTEAAAQGMPVSEYARRLSSDCRPLTDQLHDYKNRRVKFDFRL